MKNQIYSKTVVFIAVLLTLLSIPAIAGDAPHYRGKLILLVDKSVAADTTVSAKLERMEADLVGDGWRVLRTDVERGASPYLNTVTWDANPQFKQQNSPLVRQVRALIKADYDAAPNDLKGILIFGHVPVPYSGTWGAGSGGHYNGSGPADGFYAELLAPYGPGGWTDSATRHATIPDNPGDSYAPWLPQFDNLPNDGVFDQDIAPSPLKLFTGRVDLYNMPSFGVNETALLSRYLDKDHDFRWRVFSVQSKGLIGVNDSRFFIDRSGFDLIFGSANVQYYEGCTMNWFPHVSANGQDLILAYGGGGGGGSSAYTIGTTYSSTATDSDGPDCVNCDQLVQNLCDAIQTYKNNFVTRDSRVVFVNLYGSWFMSWDQGENFLKAPLANPYDPANGRFGYGLTVFAGPAGLDPITLKARALGTCIGEAMRFPSPGLGLLGDPTLRQYNVLPPIDLVASKTTSTVTLSWTASADANLGYNIYRAPTRKGPYTLVNSGYITAQSYVASRPTTGDPDNFYMVRAVKTETIAATGDSYINMSEGAIVMPPGQGAAYLAILNNPASQKMTPQFGGIANSAAFTIDALGTDPAGDDYVNYQWYKNGVALSTTDGRIRGANTRTLLVSALQASDAGNYSVKVSNIKGELTSSAASLTVDTAPIAQDDSFDVQRNTTVDLPVLGNDSDPDAGDTLTILSISALSHPEAATAFYISGDQKTVRFVGSRTWLGPVTFTYIVTDGAATAQATATITVNPTTGNQPPQVSGMDLSPKTIYEDTTLDVPFTVSDDITTPDNLVFTGACSDNNLVPERNFTVTGTGANRVLHVKAGMHRFGNGTVTMSVRDEDGAVITKSFNLTIIIRNVPTLVPGSVSGTTFSFGINGPTGLAVHLKVSDDLVNWSDLESVTLGASPYSYTATIGSSPHKFFRAESDNGCSGNTIGFSKASVPPNSFACLANQFDTPPNTLNSLFPSGPPDLAVSISKWGEAGSVTCNFDEFGGAWGSHGDETLSPGESGLFQNASAQSVEIVFSGDVRDGLLINPMPVGLRNRSSIVPQAGGLASVLGYAPMPNEYVTLYRNGAPVNYTFNGSTWTPQEPVLQIGEGFLVSHNYPNQWARDFSLCCTIPVLNSGHFVSDSQFQFNINAAVGTYVRVYSSIDLANWTQRDAFTMEGGSVLFTDNQVAGANHRFYRVEQGACCSQAVGFTRTTVNGHTIKLISNQLDAPNNTVGALLTPMANGVSVLNGTTVSKYNGTSLVTYVWDGTTWSNNGGSQSLAPGEAALLQNVNDAAIEITFVGLVREGQQSIPLTAGQGALVSSIIPQAGAIQNALGYVPSPGDSVQLWNGSYFDNYWFDEFDLAWGPSQPVLEVGGGCMITRAQNGSWTRNYSACAGTTTCTAPTLSAAQITGSSFTFSASGVAGTYWNVYSSSDLNTWTLAGGVALNGTGQGSFTDPQINGVPHRFYKLSNGTCCSQAVGFTRNTVNGHTTRLIANQLDAPNNTVAALLTPMASGVSVPNGTKLFKYNGTSFVEYDWDGSTWSNNGGSQSLAPGDAALLQNVNDAAMEITFVGLVREGQQTITLTAGQSALVSSIIPQAGGVQSALGYVPSPGDTVQLWTDAGFSSYTFDQWDLIWGPSEPVLDVGGGCMIIPAENGSWTRNYSPCP